MFAYAPRPKGCAWPSEKESPMLVLARQRDESIVIDDEIIVTVVDIRGDKVRLGINAPRSVTVHRKEIWEQIKQEMEQASKLNPSDIAGLPPRPLRTTCTRSS
jgi:carbon storage regulator